MHNRFIQLKRAGVALLFGSAGILFVTFLIQTTTSQTSTKEPAKLSVKVLSTYPHDATAFTQGLIAHNGFLYESTGLHGESTLRKVERNSGQILRKIELPEKLFGEGLAMVNDRLIQLTYKEEIALVYGIDTLGKLQEFRYAGEGWGICFDGRRLIRSDGTDRLTFHDPSTFRAIGGLRVKDRDKPVRLLNELEWWNGYIYANIFGSENIAKIDPVSGRVTAWIDASGLLTREERMQTNVLNGIAYDAETRTFLLTGKYWPKLFEVEFVAKK